jgi:hypothetical protein
MLRKSVHERRLQRVIEMRAKKLSFRQMQEVAIYALNELSRTQLLELNERLFEGPCLGGPITPGSMAESMVRLPKLAWGEHEGGNGSRYDMLGQMLWYLPVLVLHVVVQKYNDEMRKHGSRDVAIKSAADEIASYMLRVRNGTTRSEHIGARSDGEISIL